MRPVISGAGSWNADFPLLAVCAAWDLSSPIFFHGLLSRVVLAFSGDAGETGELKDRTSTNSALRSVNDSVLLVDSAGGAKASRSVFSCDEYRVADDDR